MYYMHSGDGTSIFWQKLCVLHSNFHAKCLCIVLWIFVHDMCICRLPELNWLIGWLVIIALQTFSLPSALCDGSTSLNTFEQHLKSHLFKQLECHPALLWYLAILAPLINVITYLLFSSDRPHALSALKNAGIMACGGTTATRIPNVPSYPGCTKERLATESNLVVRPMC